jgi:Skp family chaperone for outer membrane proteins
MNIKLENVSRYLQNELQSDDINEKLSAASKLASKIEKTNAVYELLDFERYLRKRFHKEFKLKVFLDKPEALLEDKVAGVFSLARFFLLEHGLTEHEPSSTDNRLLEKLLATCMAIYILDCSDLEEKAKERYKDLIKKEQEKKTKLKAKLEELEKKADELKGRV